MLAQYSDYYYKYFEWSYGGLDYYWNLTIPKALYEEYKDVSIFSRVLGGIGGYGFLTTTEDPYVESMATQLNESASEKGYNPFETVSFVLAFVQSLRYTSDNVTTGYDEYPRFPVETLVDEGGDCEDTSILFATLVILLGYGTVYLNPPDHIAVGVQGEEGIPGYYFTYDDKRFYYCETTGDGFGIGDMPDEFIDVEANIYEISLSQQYVADTIIYPATPTPTPTSTPITTPTPIPTQKPTSKPSASPEPVTDKFLPIETLLLIGVIAIIIVIVVGVAIALQKRKKQTTNQPLPPPPSEYYTSIL